MGGTVVAVAIAVLRHKPEAPLWLWVRQLGDGPVDDATLAIWVKRIEAMRQPDGTLGHVGGIGAEVVGLHEHLDAERILRAGRGPGGGGCRRSARPGASGDRAALLVRKEGWPSIPEERGGRISREWGSRRWGRRSQAKIVRDTPASWKLTPKRVRAERRG